jgi:hypothetical protein
VVQYRRYAQAKSCAEEFWCRRKAHAFDVECGNAMKQGYHHLQEFS